MADFTTETVTRTIRRWIVPAAEPWGAPAAEIGTAWSVAERAYRQQHQIPDEQPIADNAFASHRERPASVLRRALELLAQADGIVDTRGRIRTATKKAS